MNKTLVSTYLLFLLFSLNESVGQSRFYKFNQLQIDKVKAELKLVCNANGSSKQTPESELLADKKIISFLNDFYNKNMSVQEISIKMNPFFRQNGDLK